MVKNTVAHGHDEWRPDEAERLRFAVTVAGISGCALVLLQTLVLSASAFVPDALPFVLAGQLSPASAHVIEWGSSPLCLAAMVVVDMVVFWAAYRAATRSGAKAMFLPSLFYLMTCGLAAWLIAMPVCQATTLGQ